MNIGEAFVLQSDVVLLPVADLAPEVRERIEFDEGDFTLSRRHGRMPSQVIDGETAALLSLFRSPRTIVDAVIENSRTLRKDPEKWLDELMPHLGTFLQNRVLIPAGSEEDRETRPLLDPGARIGKSGEWEIVSCLRLVEDSEIYRVRNDDVAAALKISRREFDFERSLFGNEAGILRHLDGAVGPRLLDSGSHEGRPYLVLQWMPGVESSIAAAHRRHDRVALLEMCAAIASEYARLHAHGIIHSDVHPRNVLVADDGSVALLDFGLSRAADAPPRVGRGGMYYFYEPEFLTAARHGHTLPSTAAGEQYAVAALLYLLIAGRHYLDFRYEKEEMVRQVVSEAPLPFAKQGIPPWPDVEEILLRALEKDPANRFASIAELAERLDARRAATVEEAQATPLSAEAIAFTESILRDFDRGGAAYAEPYPKPPTASINFGCAGAAVGLLRIAAVRSDARLLALADIWKSRAFSRLGSDEAWYNPDDELPKDILGEVTPFHTEAGAQAAAAMIGHARGDVLARRNGIFSFIRASQRPCPEIDVTLGRCGTLLACAMLLPLTDDPDERTALLALGTETMRGIWEELDARPPIAQDRPTAYLGMAHGWSGYLYAALRWCQASGAPLPEHLERRLGELAALRVPQGRGVYWLRQVGSPLGDAMSGWCNGAAGHIFLWTLARRMLGDDRWLELARLAAWSTWDEARYVADLCCGSAGRAYGLLSLYRETGEREWLGRARQLANHAASAAVTTSQRKNALWKGELGVAVLIADLSDPERSAMPFFEA